MPEINPMAVMIDLLTTSGNYNRWHGGDNQNGATKLVITNKICQIIKDKVIASERTGRDIQMKINCLEYK